MPTAVKVELIDRLVGAGARIVEAGSFVSPKWVPQMADTAEVIQRMQHSPDVRYQVLVPNERGLEGFFKILDQNQQGPSAAADEIAIFTAATESFTRANTNCSIAESLDRLASVTERALARKLRVRGYISVVAGCPYEGREVDASRVGDIARKLVEMGCYEVSLGDTVGVGTPTSLRAVLNACVRAGVPVEKLAAHCHDTFGTGLANVLALVRDGVRTVDSAVGGLGGCPYSPGATGNIDTESVVYALHSEGFQTGIDLDEAARIGQWISDSIGRPNNSSAGRAIIAREKLQKQKEAKL